jgi:hypothetical protein
VLVFRAAAIAHASSGGNVVSQVANGGFAANVSLLDHPVGEGEEHPPYDGAFTIDWGYQRLWVRWNNRRTCPVFRKNLKKTICGAAGLSYSQRYVRGNVETRPVTNQSVLL